MASILSRLQFVNNGSQTLVHDDVMAYFEQTVALPVIWDANVLRWHDSWGLISSIIGPALATWLKVNPSMDK